MIVWEMIFYSWLFSTVCYYLVNFFSGTTAVSKAKILGNPELYIRSGSDINLTCVVLETPEPPSFIYWYQGAHVINYSQRGGISVVTEKQTRTSRLVIARALPKDSGNYTCSPSSSDSASVMVHVLNGKCSKQTEFSLFFMAFIKSDTY